MQQENRNQFQVSICLNKYCPLGISGAGKIQHSATRVLFSVLQTLTLNLSHGLMDTLNVLIYVFERICTDFISTEPYQ